MVEINLLPVREQKRKADFQQQVVLLGLSLLAAVVLAGGFHLVMMAQISDAKQRSSRLQKKIDGFAAQLAQVEEYRAKRREIEEKLGVIERLERSRSGPVHVLDELAIHTPDRMWITKLSTGNQRITLEGMSLDNELVAIFLTDLETSPYFADVELQETKLAEKDKLKLNAFKVRARLTTPGIDDVEPDEAKTAAIGLSESSGS